MNDPDTKIRVGISQRIDRIVDRKELRDGLDQRLVRWIVQAGFLPIPIPNALSNTDDLVGPPLDTWLRALRINALVLSGGNDIGEYQSRDATERYLLTWAEINRVPVLGLCRGLQMMAVWANAYLTKNVGHVGVRHRLEVPTRRDEWPVEVNSYHNWSLAFCPDRFKIAARSEDGSVEAIEHAELPWEGWMWHPEREEQFAPQDFLRLKRLFNG